MAKSQKKLTRKRFRDACYKRDAYECAVCGLHAGKEKAESLLDAHHITNRNDMPNGGYVKENGISLCEPCHIKAEAEQEIDFLPSALYKVIDSSYEEALEASDRLHS